MEKNLYEMASSFRIQTRTTMDAWQPKGRPSARKKDAQVRYETRKRLTTEIWHRISEWTTKIQTMKPRDRWPKSSRGLRRIFVHIHRDVTRLSSGCTSQSSSGLVDAAGKTERKMQTAKWCSGTG